MNAPKNRLRGSLPKVGLRPTIDGRLGGVRESLENKTMAETAAKLLSANLRYPCGMAVECVIADTCIGGVAEAASAEEKFRHGRIDEGIFDPDEFQRSLKWVQANCREGGDDNPALTL